jgi:RNA polymerase sigma-70 factor (ECF subfamily)
VHDDEIRAALRRGRIDDAFRRFVRAHGAAAFSASCRIVRDAQTAEDVMQESLISAFRNREQMLGVASLRGWLIKIATRKSLDALRATRRTGRLHEAMLRADDPVNGQDLAALLARDEGRRALEPETCAALLLRYREGVAWDEIAEAVGIPVDTIRMRVQRGALRSLRACLEAQEQDP